MSACGPRPKQIVEGFGLPVIEMEGMIEEGLEAIYHDEEIPASLRRRFTSCGASCAGGCNGCS